jgi:hypothetical protein
LRRFNDLRTISTNHIRCEDEAKAAFRVPDDVQTCAKMPIGYPVEKIGPVVRWPVAEVARSDRWSQPWSGD